MDWRRALLATSQLGATIISSSVARVDSATANLTITTPAGAQNGDLLIGYFFRRGYLRTPPAGFTTRYNNTNALENYGFGMVASLKLSGSPAANYTFGSSPSGVAREAAGILVCIRNADWGVIGAQDINNPISAPGVTMTVAGILLSFVGAHVANRTWTPPTGTTLVTNYSHATNLPSIALFSEDIGVGATGNRAFSEAGDFGILAGAYGD